MASVWFITAGVGERTITTAEWARRGVTVTEDTVWNWDNGWSLPENQFTEAQLDILDGDPAFLLGQPDGPRDQPPLPPDPTKDDKSAYAYYRAVMARYNALGDDVAAAVAPAVAADLASRNITHEDAGGGEWYLAAGGVPIGEPRPAPATTWSAVVGRPPDPDRLFDGLSEWWCRPTAVYLNDRWGPRTIFGAIGKNNGSGAAPILACEFNHASRTVLRVQVATAGVDDHNAPAIWCAPGRRPIIAWSNHNGFNYAEAKVGARNGDIRSFASAPIQQIQSSNPPGAFSYTQLVHIPSLSDDAQDTFWMFSRIAPTGGTEEWRIFPLRIDQATGVLSEIITAEHTYGDFRLIDFELNKGYVTVSDAVNAEGGQVIRCAWGYNPNPASSSVHGVGYFEIDVTTGDITSPFDEGLAANVDGTGLPMIHDEQTLAIPEPPAGWSRRLFYTRPGPASRGFLYAEGPIADPDNWPYKQKRELGGENVDGLVVNANSRASAGYVSAMTMATGFRYRTRFQFAANPLANVELGRRYGASGSARSWRFMIRSDRTLSVLLARTTTTSYDLISTIPIPNSWTSMTQTDMAFGVTVDYSSGAAVVHFEYSTDGGATWSNLGDPVTNPAATSILASTLDLEVPSTSGALLPTGLLRRATLLTLGGAVVADMNFAEWPLGDATRTDSAGVLWTLQGSAPEIQKPDKWVTEEFGIAGQRIGYTAGANYLPGMSYPEPCFEDTFYAAYYNAGTGVSEVKEWRRQRNSDGSYTWLSTVIDSASGDGPRLARPMSPLNGGPHRVLDVRVNEYGSNDFTQYAGDIQAVL